MTGEYPSGQLDDCRFPVGASPDMSHEDLNSYRRNNHFPIGDSFVNFFSLRSGGLIGRKRICSSDVPLVPQLNCDGSALSVVGLNSSLPGEGKLFLNSDN